MSLFFRPPADRSPLSSSLIPPRPRVGRGAPVTASTAMRQSAVWAAITLRADLMSSFPIDVYRRVAGIQIEVPKPPVLIAPSGDQLTMREWVYSTQMDLDRVGNCYGIIVERDGAGRPARIDLVPHDSVAVRVKGTEITYQIKGKTYQRNEIWHERQYTLPGLAMGLSPIAWAAWSLGMWSTAADFANDWFTARGIRPSGLLKNTAKTLTDGEADRIKERFKVAVEDGDILVTGNDWDFTTGPAVAQDMQFLATMGYSDQDAARFFGVPGDMIDVATKGSSITYANITQRNLQFLITKLGPAVARREDALSSLLAPPRFVKLNTSAVLRMDPETQSRILINEVQGKVTAPSEARALMNRAPFTPEQIAEFEQLGIVAAGTPAPATVITTEGQST
ncbi:phage portal protein [uncultured Microbacterium sp.]|uniref:phage portal protein n=1 Tax=uncultured Microbacterium sp. TaxID=191216 RepID=UPI0025D2F868|nr:phage portal protein [uncultured Microbacterium sp.]